MSRVSAPRPALRLDGVASFARRHPDLALLVPLLIVAAGLRYWGIKNGLPFVYNADENAHFVPRAIGMFGHSYNPDYFINPPGYTYAVHIVYWLAFGSRHDVGLSFAKDPTTVFTLARAVSAFAGVITVLFMYLAGKELSGGDRTVGFFAGALICVAFLPVHYSHLALNDVPTLAPLAFSLWGAARVYWRGGWKDFVIAGVGLGLACATKYTAGAAILSLLVATFFAPLETWKRALGIGVILAAMFVGFAVANPYALFDYHAFREGLDQQSQASNDGGGKLGLDQSSGWTYYLGTLVWGFGVVPLLAAIGGVVELALRDRRILAWIAPTPLFVFYFLGSQDRFFARWLLPAYPSLALLAAFGLVALVQLAPRERSRFVLAVVGVVALAQGLVYAVHNDRALARPDTRGLARQWMLKNVPEGSKVVIEPVMPDQWATNPGHPSFKTGNGNRWIKWTTSRSRVTNEGKVNSGGKGRRVKLEDYERTTRPELVGSYARGGFCWVLIGSTQYGRAYADPRKVPQAIAYYNELKRVGKLVYHVSPEGAARKFSFDSSFNARPLDVARMGPEISIYRLPGADVIQDSKC